MPNLITEGGRGVKKQTKSDYVICERPLKRKLVTRWDIFLKYGGIRLEYFSQNLEKMITTTITFAPVSLKWMERVILWHMETDLKIYSKLSKKQYGFNRGCSTIAATHKLVRKLEIALLNLKVWLWARFLTLKVHLITSRLLLLREPFLQTAALTVSTSGSCQ